jgi:hypothetical protein
MTGTMHIQRFRIGRWAFVWLAVISVGPCTGGAAETPVNLETAEVARRLQAMPPGHPRLFLPRGAETALRRQLEAHPVMSGLLADLRREADRELGSVPVERVQVGRRLLDKSRTALARVLHLALAWRLTGERRYLDRARAELVAVAKFSDWNPSHFLDVAEMTTAVAIGYDWLYAELDEPTRRLLREAIVEKGLNPSLKHNAWTRARNNWNQVCNGGMAIGALAVAESEPALAAGMIARAVNTVPISMHEYDPDGAYPEGPGYWAYGTTYNVLLIAALESALGTDFGLTGQPGFLATADYYLHVVGPSGYFFNYSDCSRGGQGVAPAMFWFAARRQEPYLLWNDWPKLIRADDRASRGRDRFAPLLLLWMAGNQPPASPPPALSWTGHGPVPVAFHRSSWERDASFVAIKGGSPSANHAHMDVGAFVMDAGGVRWADDLGMQSYNSLESQGVRLWDRKQDSDRWKVFRLGTASHNVLMVDGGQQRVDGDARIVKSTTDRTLVDWSAIYQDQIAQARRGVALHADRSVRVQDEFRTLDRRTRVRWAMVTFADVTIDGPGRATLAQGGQTLRFRVLEPTGAKLEIYPTDPPPSPLDAANPGSRMIGFSMELPASSAQRFVVHLAPGSAGPAAAAEPILPLAAW